MWWINEVIEYKLDCSIHKCRHVNEIEVPVRILVDCN